jgi:hypothetical protein
MRASLMLVLASLAASVAGCGDGSTSAPQTVHPNGATLAERKAIFDDWYADGRIDGVYSCAVVQNAIHHLPSSPPTYSTVLQDFQRYERHVC